jgi:hypothetical protein
MLADRFAHAGDHREPKQDRQQDNERKRRGDEPAHVSGVRAVGPCT